MATERPKYTLPPARTRGRPETASTVGSHLAKLARLLILSSVALVAMPATPTAAQDANPDEPPLPLAANWNCKSGNGYGPAWQFAKMKQGHHLLFTFRFGRGEADQAWQDRLQPIFAWLAEQKAPICLRWGNLINDVKDRSPFSPKELWRSAGKAMMEAHAAKLKLMQQWYPDPPQIVMLSNNEGKAPRMKKVLKSEAFQSKHGDVKDEMAQQKIVGGGFVERYKALFDGMREAAGPWGERMRFIGYA